MYPVKNESADLKLAYRKVFEISLVVSLGIHLMFFQLFPGFSLVERTKGGVDLKIMVEDIPQTEQIRNMAPPPARPSVPVPTGSEEVPEDATIESTNLELDLTTLPPPPPPGEGDIEAGYVFIPFDEPPTPVGGYAGIQAHLRYPEIARKAGMEGTVIIGVLVDESGRAVKTQILKPAGSNIGFEEAAETAVMKTKWKPARQRDRAVKVWVSVPVRFQLTTLRGSAS